MYTKKLYEFLWFFIHRHKQRLQHLIPVLSTYSFMWHVLHAILNVFGVLYTGLSDTFSCVLLTVSEITNSNSALQ